MKDGKKRVWKALGGGEVQSDATEAEIDDASALGGLFAEDRVGVGADHGDAFRLARNGIEAGLFWNNLKGRRRDLQR